MPDMTEVELRRGREPVGELGLELLPGISNSRVKEALNGLAPSFTKPENLEPVFSLLAPIAPSAYLTAQLEPRPGTAESQAPTNLWEQVGLAYLTYPYLERRDQVNLLALTGRALAALDAPLEFKIHGETRALFPHVRQYAQEVRQAFGDFQKEELKRLVERGKLTKRPLPVPRVVARLAPLLGLIAASCGPISAPRPPDVGGGVTPGVTETAPLPPPTVEAAPTSLPGGPETPVVAPWPTSFAEIPSVVPAAGGPFTFESDAPNVVAQEQAVAAKVTSSGWLVVETPNQLTSGQTAYVAPTQESDRWAIAAMTNDGFLVPVDQEGRVMDRPDWATNDVARYQEISDGLGPGYNRRFELIGDHWVPVTRARQGRARAFYDVVAQEWRYDLEGIPRSMAIIGMDRDIVPAGVQIPESMTAFLADSPSQHFLNGTDLVPFGETLDFTQALLNIEIGLYDQQTVAVVTRFRGIFPTGVVDWYWKAEDYVAVFEIPLSPTTSIFLTTNLIGARGQIGPIYWVQEGNLAEFINGPRRFDANTEVPNITRTGIDWYEFVQLLSSPATVGQPAIIEIMVNVPDQGWNSEYRLFGEQLVAAIRSRRLPPESIRAKASRTFAVNTWWSASLKP